MRIVSIATPLILIVFAASTKGFTCPRRSNHHNHNHQVNKQQSLPQQSHHGNTGRQHHHHTQSKTNPNNQLCSPLHLQPPQKTQGSNNGRRMSTALNSINTKAITWVASTVIGGALGTPIVVSGTKSWYKTIPLPSYTPPNKVFMPVWTTLYALMGIASFRIKSLAFLAQGGGGSTSGLGIFSATCAITSWLQENIMVLSYIHYALNLVWAPIFFGLLKFRLGHVLNVVLFTTLIPILYTYATLDVVSGLMLLPYWIWLGVATRLSRGICQLNPTNGKDYFFNNAKLQKEIWKLRQEAGKRVGL